MSVEPDFNVPAVTNTTASFLKELAERGFKGDIGSDLANRLTGSTDNSIYQVIPQAIVFPLGGDDLTLVTQVANSPAFADLKFYPRGGGTSTNGQSLGAGIVIDTSRHMRAILGFGPETNLITVEPGLIRDALIDHLKPYGLFFPPHVSTTSRATIGGMVSNDSSGKGSVIYGKTSDHIEAMDIVLPNGKTHTLTRNAKGDLADQIGKILAPYFDKIGQRFPKMKRGFTGYNMKEARHADGTIDLVKLFCGSEGTLGLIKSITCRTTPIPAHTALVVAQYASHDAGLRAVPEIMKSRPAAIEFIDDRILEIAMRSPFASDMRAVLGAEAGQDIPAVQFVEFVDNDAGSLERHLTDFQNHQAAIADKNLRPTSLRIVHNADQIAKVWEMRRASQGLIARYDQKERAIAFIEDCAVPPENLADFVAELGALLEQKNIPVGMYGHADVGCVHIRPLMDLTDAQQRDQIREISDAVCDLTLKYGGLIWGEHGKGFRGEYSEKFIGATLTGVMRQIKAVFDPDNRMNPGKIAHPDGALIALDRAQMRGELDAQTTPELREAFVSIMRCDGNGACFNMDETLPFCPSYKATGDRRFSPKGRAGLLREWVRARSNGVAEADTEMADELHFVLDSCLACKACAGAGCSARVDIPQMKSQFLEWYYQTRRRPLTDHVVANLERLAPMLDRIGGVVNLVQKSPLVASLSKRWLGLVDLPQLRSRRDYLSGLRRLGVKTLPVRKFMQLPQSRRAQTVIVVQDCFTSFYDADVLLAQVELIQKLGFSPIILSYREGGKPLHVKGFLKRFKKLAGRNAAELAQLDQAGFTLLGVDSATTLMYRHEYVHELENIPDFTVKLLSEWLQTIDLPQLKSSQTYTLIQHCTERSLQPETSAAWAEVFKATNLNVQIIKAGCCGMSGLFGHEATHQDISTTLYEQNWRQHAENGRLVATGYSCRSQVKRLSNIKTLHPAQIFLENWESRL